VGAFATKNRQNPSILLRLYMTLVYGLALLPVLLVQSVTFQCWRICKAFWLVLIGRVVYRTKSKTKND
jgi:hypothetical protein